MSLFHFSKPAMPLAFLLAALALAGGCAGS